MAWKPIDIDPVNVTRSSARKACKLLHIYKHSTNLQQWLHMSSTSCIMGSMERFLLLHRIVTSYFRFCERIWFCKSETE